MFPLQTGGGKSIDVKQARSPTFVPSLDSPCAKSRPHTRNHQMIAVRFHDAAFIDTLAVCTHWSRHLPASLALPVTELRLCGGSRRRVLARTLGPPTPAAANRVRGICRPPPTETHASQDWSSASSPKANRWRSDRLAWKRVPRVRERAAARGVTRKHC